MSFPFGYALAPILLLFLRGSRREALLRKLELTREMRDQRQRENLLKKSLIKEAKVYQQLIVNSLIRQGEAHIPRSPDLSTMGKNRRIGKVQKVRFDRRFVTPERAFFKIAVNKRFIFATKNVLPFGVYIRNITSDDAVFELSMACERRVTAEVGDSRKGAWYVVDRLEAWDGIPNHVSYSDMLEHYPEDNSKAHIILGVGQHRKVHMVDFASYPHALIGGSTGTGKSNFVNNLICNLLRFSDPKDLRLVLVDFKELEFAAYEGLPNLWTEVVFEPVQTLKILEEMLSIIKVRQRMMKGKARELSEWNRLYPDQAMPRIVLIIDEFAEIVLSDDEKIAKQSLTLITRIGNIGRAIGVHMVLCTQRPAVETLPMRVKANLPLIVAGRTANQHHSRVIFDDAQASTIPNIKGRMKYRANTEVEEVQTPHITESDVRESIAIAHGRFNEVIRIEHGQARLDPAGLTKYIIDCLGGWVHGGQIWQAVKGMAIRQRELQAYLQDLKTMVGQEIEVDSLRYVLEKRGKGWRFMPAPGQMPQEDRAKVRIERLQSPDRLALPEPSEPEEVIELPSGELPPPLEDAPIIDIPDYKPEIVLNGLISLYYDTDPIEMVRFSTFYADYLVYCIEKHVESESKQKIGMLMAKFGFKSVQKGTKRERYLKGLKQRTDRTDQTSIDVEVHAEVI